MKVNIASIKKEDVSKLSAEELAELVAWEKSDSYKILQKIGEEAIMRRALEAMHSVYSELKGAVEHGRLSGMPVGINFILAAPKRARHELKDRNKDE